MRDIRKEGVIALKLWSLEKQVDDLIKENQELKKQLNDYKNRYKNYLYNQLSEDIEPDGEDFYLAEIEGKSNEYDKLIITQKEFIAWLERQIENIRNEIEENRGLNFNSQREKERLTLKHNVLFQVLSKYDEITGVKDE